MTNIYIRAAIKLLEKHDNESALFLLGYILNVIENNDISLDEAEQAGDILSNLE